MRGIELNLLDLARHTKFDDNPIKSGSTATSNKYDNAIVTNDISLFNAKIEINLT